MQKIISVFQRNYDGDRLIRNEVVPGAEWVLAYEGIATRKYDGTCCMITEGKFYRRYEAKTGKPRPPGFIAAQAPDPITGDCPGWVEVDDNSANKWHIDALNNFLYTHLDPHDLRAGVERLSAWWKKRAGETNWQGKGRPIQEFTFEAIGPQFQGNPEGYEYNTLIEHGSGGDIYDVPRDFDQLREWLSTQDIEGIVFHHPDGRMAKVKKKDFGLRRKPE